MSIKKIINILKKNCFFAGYFFVSLIVKRLMCEGGAHGMMFTLGVLLRPEQREAQTGRIPVLSNIIQADYCDFFFFCLRATLKARR